MFYWLDDTMSKLTFLLFSTGLCWPMAAISAAPTQAVTGAAGQHHHTHHQAMDHSKHQPVDHSRHQMPASQPQLATPAVPAPTALADLMPAAMVPPQDWRQANQQVLVLGGWQFYLQEAATTPGIPTGTPTGTAPATPKPEAAKEQHHAHH